VSPATGGTIVFVEVVLPPVEFGTYSGDRTIELKPSAFKRREEAAASYLISAGVSDVVCGRHALMLIDLDGTPLALSLGNQRLTAGRGGRSPTHQAGT
jgi:hypothetical protein